MAPTQIKQSRSTPSSATTTQTLTNSQDARLLVRETIRLSANLASSPLPSSSFSSCSPLVAEKECSHGIVEEEYVNSSLRVICREEIDGRHWKYVAETDDSGRFKKASLRSISLETTPQEPLNVSRFLKVTNTYIFGIESLSELKHTCMGLFELFYPLLQT